jgi:hypothetical protein
MILRSNANEQVMDKHFSLKCPHCQNATSITPLSPPSYSALARYKPNKIGIAYKCNSCEEPIFLKFEVFKYDIGNNYISISDEFETVETSMEGFEYDFLTGSVKDDLREALLCYSIGAYNAFAAMCRRTIQSTASELGVKGKDKVQRQITELKDMAEIDDDTFTLLKQIMIDGHDGSHPHLPSLSRERAAILLELIKDVVYQLFVRKAKVAKAAELRQQQIKNSIP